MRKLPGLFVGLITGVALSLPAALVFPTDVADAANGKRFEQLLDRRFAKLLRRADRRGVVEGGTALGTVTDTADPEALGRVRVRFPWLDTDDVGVWARTVAASDGSQFQPEVDDEVLVTFISGDVRHPVVIGAIWNPADRPPN